MWGLNGWFKRVSCRSVLPARMRQKMTRRNLQPSVWLEKSWKLRLVTVVPQLVVEANAVTEAAKLSHDKLESQKAKKIEQASKAEKRLSKLNHHLSLCHCQRPACRRTQRDLHGKTVRVRLLEHAFDKCAKCRWQSSCLECDAFKCFRYHFHLEAATAQKLPYLSTRPEDLEQPEGYIISCLLCYILCLSLVKYSAKLSGFIFVHSARLSGF